MSAPPAKPRARGWQPPQIGTHCLRMREDSRLPLWEVKNLDRASQMLQVARFGGPRRWITRYEFETEFKVVGL